MRHIFLLTVALVLILSFSFEDGPHESNGDPLFTLLSADRTKIKFNNKLQDLQDHNIMIYSNFYGGAGVAVGDINNDGLEDIYFAGNQVGDQLYLNKGGLQFSEITRKAGIKNNGGWSSGVIMGDVNQDGLLDIYVTRELYDDDVELRRNKLYINQGNNSFEEQAQLYGVDNSERTRHAAFFDYDLDGDLDLFLCNQPPNPGSYSKFKKNNLIKEQYHVVLYNYDAGKYHEVTEQAGLDKTGFPNSVTTADLNDDGWPDLFVANDFWIEDWIFINNGDGTFSNQLYERAKHISFSSMGVDAGDINNDGQLDLIVVDMAAEDNYRSKTNMSGMNPKAFWKVVNDGGHYQYMFNILHLNQGGGYFSDVAQLSGVATTDWSWSPLIADFDNDGWKDLHITNGLLRDIRNNDASKEFPKYLESKLFQYIQRTPNPPADISVWDVVDIKKALEIVPSEKLTNYAYRNNGDLTFSKVMQDWGMDQKSFSGGSAYADLDNDGDLDLVVNNINDLAFVYENNSVQQKRNSWVRVKPVPQKKGANVLGVKVNIVTDSGNQYFEITGVRGMYSQSEQIAHFGIGSDTEIDTMKVLWPDGRQNILTGIPANQVVEVPYVQSTFVPNDLRHTTCLLQNVTTDFPLQYHHRENEFDDYASQVLLPHKMSSHGPQISKGDINGDGLEDIFIGGAAGRKAELFIQNMDGTFVTSGAQIFAQHKDFEDIGSVFFDVDQDGDEDLYVVSGGNEFATDSDMYLDRLYLNDGKGHFSYAKDKMPIIRSSGSKVRAADFDLDGDLDLVVAGRHVPRSYPEPASSYLLVNEEGVLINKSNELAPDLTGIGIINDVKWLDVNRDERLDLILVGEWTGIILLENTLSGFKRSSSPELNDQKGWWFSVDAADMDGDGDDDLILGNLGLNYKYKATPTEPFEVYYYDFDENGSKDVVLTYYNFGIQYPLRGRECSSQQVPAIKDEFKNYDLFASSDVSAIYGDSKLEQALHLEANDFSSCYAENLGSGRFKISTLPVDAQISSINDFVIDDFNGDDHLDILLAGNLYDAEVETARADAGYGLLLLGDGKGGFSPISKDESGFYVPYDVKSLETIKSGGQKIILVGCNNDEMKVFKHQTSFEGN